MEGVGGHPAEQRPRLGGPQPPGDEGRRRQGRKPEAGQAQGMGRDVGQRPHHVDEEVVETFADRSEQPGPAAPVRPESLGGGADRLQHDAGGPVVEGVGEGDLGPAPPQSVPAEVDLLQERRAHRQGVDGGAVVVEEPVAGQVAGAGAAPDGVGRLEDSDGHTLAGEGDGGGQPVGPGPHDDGALQLHQAPLSPRLCIGQAPAVAGPVGTPTDGVGTGDVVSSTGISPAHGWRSSMSEILTRPRSNSPVAASTSRYSWYLPNIGDDSTMTTRTSPGSNPHRSWRAVRSCSSWRWPSPKFQPMAGPARNSPSIST